MRRLLPLMLVAFVLGPTRADALTLRDVLELTRAGLGDDVLIALIEVDRPVFPVDTETLKTLKDAGVSQKVIVAMIKSGRTPPPPAPEPPVIINPPEPAPAPQPPVVVIHEQPVPMLPGYGPGYAPGYATGYVQSVIVPGYFPFGVPSRARAPFFQSSYSTFQPPSGLSAPPPLPSTNPFGPGQFGQGPVVRPGPGRVPRGGGQ
jgi:hypothetical protein